MFVVAECEVLLHLASNKLDVPGLCFVIHDSCEYA